jgi:hypothetical protein
MRQLGSWTACLTLALLPALASAQSAPMTPVFAFFTALSEGNPQGIRNAITPDMQILEQGEVWNLDKVLSLANTTTSVRRNFYSPISEHERGDTVLINYWNKALIRLASGEERTVGWLESVVVVKDRGEWRILQMHSTRLTPEQIPTNVEFREQR